MRIVSSFWLQSLSIAVVLSSLVTETRAQLCGTGEVLLKNDILPEVNLFCYGQVESPYGSGEFIRSLSSSFGEDQENLILSEIPGQDAIYDSIKTFLGKGK